ncbi:MAG: hypothetical protein Q9M16_00415 [Mariprofundus sp.]|nr:hypothetical protein [Mariprofundus sp.]
MCFHVDQIIIRRMLTHYLHTRGLSRLMAVLFAVQIVVGGFCLLTSEASAMPQANQNMHAHCEISNDVAVDGTVNEHVAGDQHAQDHGNNCFHCDQPDQLSNSASSLLVSMLLVLSDEISLPAVVEFDSNTTGLLSTRTPTGPPRSASLLYSTSQRILI